VFPAAPHVPAVTALLGNAYRGREYLGASVAGKLWEAVQVLGQFPGQQVRIILVSRSQALQLYRILVPPG
jgi:hypothetical protein